MAKDIISKGDFKIFTSKEQVGINSAQTPLTIAQAMPDLSILITEVSGTISDPPIGWGVLELVRLNNNRWYAKIYSQYANDDKYREYACAGTWNATTAWKTLFNA